MAPIHACIEGGDFFGAKRSACGLSSLSGFQIKKIEGRPSHHTDEPHVSSVNEELQKDKYGASLVANDAITTECEMSRCRRKNSWCRIRILSQTKDGDCNTEANVKHHSLKDRHSGHLKKMIRRSKQNLGHREPNTTGDLSLCSPSKPKVFSGRHTNMIKAASDRLPAKDARPPSAVRASHLSPQSIQKRASRDWEDELHFSMGEGSASPGSERRSKKGEKQLTSDRWQKKGRAESQHSPPRTSGVKTPPDDVPNEKLNGLELLARYMHNFRAKEAVRLANERKLRILLLENRAQELNFIKKESNKLGKLRWQGPLPMEKSEDLELYEAVAKQLGKEMPALDKEREDLVKVDDDSIPKGGLEDLDFYEAIKKQMRLLQVSNKEHERRAKIDKADSHVSSEASEASRSP